MTEEQQDRPCVAMGSLPPDSPEVTDYDRSHIVVYVRLLDAAAANIDWRVASAEILNIDPSHEPAAAKLTFDSHLARANWLTRVGYRLLAEPKSMPKAE